MFGECGAFEFLEETLQDLAVLAPGVDLVDGVVEHRYPTQEEVAGLSEPEVINEDNDYGYYAYYYGSLRCINL